MSRYNKYLDSKFHGCQVIGHRDDPGRARRIMVYAMPDDYAMIGLFDGVDAWVTEARGADLIALQSLADGAVYEVELGQHRARFADGSYIYGSEMADIMGIGTTRSRRRIGEAPPPAQAELPLASTRRRISLPTQAEVLPRERRRVHT